MAINLWGKVYYKDAFAGYLSQEPGNRYTFQYDDSYLETQDPNYRAIAYTLPLQKAPHISEDGLHPFFDNLVAEGWLQQAQARALGVRRNDRFALLLGFGQDCAGATSIIDPKPAHEMHIDLEDPQDFAALAGRASLSGIQPKMTVVAEKQHFRPIKTGEVSTHIAKLHSSAIPHILANEYLTTIATQALLKHDAVAEVQLQHLEAIDSNALIIKRFDRTPDGGKIHFEEFNQLLGNPSIDKYEADYLTMANFMHTNPTLCLPLEVEKLYRRILACILVGNTDAHLKNFAMLYTPAGLRLTPAYDLVASSLYPEYQIMALSINHTPNMRISKLQPQHLIRMGQSFQLPNTAIQAVASSLEQQLPHAKAAIQEATGITDTTLANTLKSQLITLMEKRWNGTFRLIGQQLSKRR